MIELTEKRAILVLKGLRNALYTYRFDDIDPEIQWNDLIMIDNTVLGLLQDEIGGRNKGGANK